MSKPDYIVSDTHLGAVPRETEREFIRFLEHAGANAATLLINGDLFDFWFEWGPVIPAKYYRVLAGIAAVVDAGVPVTLIGGNHDAWGGPFLRDEVGIRMHHGELRTRLGGRAALVAHGDGLGKGDFKYRFLKLTLRSRLATFGFRALHPEIGMRIADRVSTTEAKAAEDHSSIGRAEFIEEWARQQLVDDPGLRLIVCGHSHVPTLIEVAPGRHYVNSGDWVGHRTYVTVAEGEAPVMREWLPHPRVPHQ
ncbi:MAG: UDP-2,3-diacylglucosamine diphosphatase [Gemmatimonadota bacterium]